MTGFREYLTEAKNTHITHLEDVVLDDGPGGVKFVINTLRSFARILNGGTISRSLNVSVKWDGAPALIFGPDPADGQFFVATKSGAFRKTPGLAKTHSDIDRMYESGVKNILHAALDYLSALKPKYILQGDVLFTSSTLSDKSIDGKNYITFQPNTILYAIDGDSALGRRVSAADFGIVLHTVYTGKSQNLTDYSASALNPSIFSQLNKVKNVVVLDAQYDDVSGTATFTEQESDDFELAIAEIEHLAGNVTPAAYDLVLSEPVHSFMQMFLNAQVRANNSRPSVQDLVEFLGDRRNKEMSARKSDQAKKSVEFEFHQVIGRIRDNQRALSSWLQLHQAITRAKNIIVRKLGQASSVASFVPTSQGLRVTGPEGFVAVSHSGKTVKLVDRLEFSRLNFQSQKSWS